MAYDIIIGRNDADKKKLGDKGTVFLGKLFVTMGQTTSLSNPMFLDVATTHVLLICGKRGSGKCLLGDTLVTLDDGSVVPIKQLEHDSRKVLGLNDYLKINSLKKEGFYKRIVHEILRLRLRSGKEIELTPEHPLLTIKGWTSAQDFCVGDRIATPRIIPCFGTLDMEDYKIKLLAYLLAEGHIKGSWVLFSNINPEIVEDFKTCIFRFSSELKVEVHSKPGCYRVARKNNPHGRKKNYVKEWLQHLGTYGKLSKNKFIPQEIFRLSKESLALFLRTLFSCDGSIYLNLSRNGWEIDYSTSSILLAKQVHHLLLRFEVLSKIRTKQTKCNGKWFQTYELVIGSDNLERYISQIGFIHPDKIIKSQQCLRDIQNVKRNPNVDTIPKEIWQTYRPANWAKIGRAVGYAHPKAMRERIHYAPSRTTLLQIGEVEQNSALIQLATSDIFWDEVVSLEKIEGTFEVYDLGVPTTHNFIANDIIVHNSYSSSVIAEEMARLPPEIKNNLSVLFFDTLGVFWTMKYPNTRQETLLQNWGLQPEGLNIKLFVPVGMYSSYINAGIPADAPFALRTSELQASDWSDIFVLSLTDSIGLLLERVINIVKERVLNYSLQDIIDEIEADTRSTRDIKDALINRFLTAGNWGLFAADGTKIEDLLQPGQVTVLDTSAYTNISGGRDLKALVISIVCKRLLQERVVARKAEELEDLHREKSYFYEELVPQKPLVWLMLDEAHEFLKKDEKTPATDALVQILREGRQPGISLCLVTQQPGEIHKDVLTQSDVVISHRLTAKADIEALNSMMQSYLFQDLQKSLNELPKAPGAALILDDNSERIYPMHVHPKRSWHGGEAPSAIKIKKNVEWELQNS